MNQTHHWLNRVPSKVILWTWPVARILMCGLTYLLFSLAARDPVFAKPLQLHFFAWFGWTVATTLFAVAGPMLQPRLLRIILIGDGLLTLAAIVLLRGAEGATIAFATCISVIAISIRVPGGWVLAGHALAALTFLLRDIAMAAISSRALPLFVNTELWEILQTTEMLLMLFVFIS